MALAFELEVDIQKCPCSKPLCLHHNVTAKKIVIVGWNFSELTKIFDKCA